MSSWFVCLQCGDLVILDEGDVEVELCYRCMEIEGYWAFDADDDVDDAPD